MSLLSTIISMVFHVVGGVLIVLLLAMLVIVILGIFVEGQLDDEIYNSWPT